MMFKDHCNSCAWNCQHQYANVCSCVCIIWCWYVFMHVYVYIYVWMYVCMYVCIYIYIYIYICRPVNQDRISKIQKQSFRYQQPNNQVPGSLKLETLCVFIYMRVDTFLMTQCHLGWRTFALKCNKTSHPCFLFFPKTCGTEISSNTGRWLQNGREEGRGIATHSTKLQCATRQKAFGPLDGLAYVCRVTLFIKPSLILVLPTARCLSVERSKRIKPIEIRVLSRLY